MSETIARDRREYMKQYRESHKEHLADLNHALWERIKNQSRKEETPSTNANNAAVALLYLEKLIMKRQGSTKTH